MNVLQAAAAVHIQGQPSVNQQEKDAHVPRQAQPVHLRNDKNAAEAKGEHGPKVISLLESHKGTVQQHCKFQRKRPPAIYMHACEEKAALQKQEEHIDEAKEMPAGTDHRVKPEGIHRGPGEVVAVVFACEVHNVFRHGHLRAEEHAPPRILHEQNPDQHDDHRHLRTPYRDILRQPVIPDMRLQEMQPNEESIHDQSGDIHQVQATAVAFDMFLGVVNQAPESNLVCEVKASRRRTAPESRIW